MCGIFGEIAINRINISNVATLAKHAKQRGSDSSGLIAYQNDTYSVYRATRSIERLNRRVKIKAASLVLGHSRLITNGLADNQPVVRNDICVLHNGIIVNADHLWAKYKLHRNLQIDTEIIAALVEFFLAQDVTIKDLPVRILKECRGVVSCAIALTKLGKLLLFSNNGSLYVGMHGTSTLFSSECYPLEQMQCKDIRQLCGEPLLLDIPVSMAPVSVTDYNHHTNDLIPALCFNKTEEKLLEYHKPDLKRCTRCILPETMPFISFDEQGVCNYCRSYKLRNKPKPKEELYSLVERYRRSGERDCIVPFSGGRDSCFGLHLVVKELSMKPVAYTYDWGMVTDLGRRNISRMCSALGVENIIVAADIAKKRKNIAMNLSAWLKSPHLGMISILTSGDKHFFRYVEDVKQQTGIQLNLWGVNPLEVTHFKAGFLGIKPDFEEERVYTHGAFKQLRYQSLRFKAMLASPGYFNSSLWDTLSGEYYRSFTKKQDYFHIFDYYRWDEPQIDETLAEYDWERATDTSTTWRIGDGTAGFYNYIYHTVAGFTEHDTFRSNQIREGDISREEALRFVEDENKPRYSNIRWYLDTLGFDFTRVIKTIHDIPKLYSL